MGIRDENTSTGEILRDARFHVAALKADPRTAVLADGVKGLMTTLKTRRSATEDKEDLRTEALARLLRVDFELDDKLRLVELDVLKETSKNRADARYRGAFPRGLSALLALRGEDEAREVRALVGRLRESLPALATAYGPDLERLAAAAIEADGAWRQAEMDAAQTFGGEVQARIDLVRQLQKNEGALLAELPGQRRRVRSFFRPTRRRGAVADDGRPEEPGAPVP